MPLARSNVAIIAAVDGKGLTRLTDITSAPSFQAPDLCFCAPGGIRTCTYGLEVDL
jgi:hypothetical protein